MYQGEEDMKVTAAEKKAGIISKDLDIGNGVIICKVDLQKIGYDSYQRKIAKNHIAKLMANWVKLAARLPLVSFRNGALWGVDGQHTIKVKIVEDGRFGYVQLFFNLDKTDEANIFFLENTMPRKVNSWKAFSSAVIAKRNPQTDMMDMIKEYEYTTPLDFDEDDENKKEADLTAVEPLTNAYQNSRGSKVVFDKLLFAYKAWIFDNKQKVNDAKQNYVLNGLINFIKNHPELTKKKIYNLLKTHSADEVIDYAKSLNHNALRVTPKMVCDSLEDSYNYSQAA